ncbi:MAG: PQQ-dependent sugar dehydrogenase [Rhodospirillales bacterium]|nr:PQQ-dependent sugar dehydrogenase [Rhodospirillales bacterium]
MSRATVSTDRAATAVILVVGALDASSPIPAQIVEPRPAPVSLDTTTVPAIADDYAIESALDALENAILSGAAASDPDPLDNPLALALQGSDEGNDTLGDRDTAAGDADDDTSIALESADVVLDGFGADTDGVDDSVSSPPRNVENLVFNTNSGGISGIGDELSSFMTGRAVTGALHIQADLIASGLATPLFAASPPGDPGRLFILEKDSGRVVILDLAANQLLPQPFFDVPAAEMTNDGERGLLGLAFHPDYVTNGKLYLNLTNENGDTEIWELTRSGDPNFTDPLSQRTLLTVFRDPALSNHNGGWIGFAPDGLLYIATGDGGSGNDPANNAQDINDLRGKILRIDVNSDAFPADPGRNYAIPPNNAFVGTNGADEVFAYGLRNPWRASFDSQTGDFYIADVGQNAREELNFLAAGTGAGTNFGWRVMEGNLPTGLPQLGNPPAGDPSLRAPILDYSHGLGDFQGRTIVGGYVYHGPGGAQGLYFFGDFISNHIWTVRVEDGQAFDFTQRDDEIVTNAGTVDQIASFATDGSGQLYAIGLDGEIFRLAPSEDVSPAPGEPAASGDDGGGDWGEVLLVTGAIMGLATWLF